MRKITRIKSYTTFNPVLERLADKKRKRLGGRKLVSDPIESNKKWPSWRTWK